MKLVRDKVPKLYPAARYRKVLDSKERQRLLLQKLAEETGEAMSTFSVDGLLEELVDVLEVAYARAAVHGVSEEDMQSLRARKVEQRGAFREGWVLLGLDEE